MSWFKKEKKKSNWRLKETGGWDASPKITHYPTSVKHQMYSWSLPLPPSPIGSIEFQLSPEAHRPAVLSNSLRILRLLLQPISTPDSLHDLLKLGLLTLWDELREITLLLMFKAVRRQPCSLGNKQRVLNRCNVFSVAIRTYVQEIIQHIVNDMLHHYLTAL